MLRGSTTGGICKLQASPSTTVDETMTTTTFTLPQQCPTSDYQVLTVDQSGNMGFDTLYKMNEMSFVGNQNVTTWTDVTDLIFTKWFSCDIFVYINKSSGNYSAIYSLRGFVDGSSWQLYVDTCSSTTGVDNSATLSDDNDLILFTITADGQVQYKSANIPGWTSTTFKWIKITPTP